MGRAGTDEGLLVGREQAARLNDSLGLGDELLEAGELPDVAAEQLDADPRRFLGRLICCGGCLFVTFSILVWRCDGGL